MRASVLLLAAASAVVASAETVELFGAGDAGGDFVAYPVGSVSWILLLTIGPSNQKQ